MNSNTDGSTQPESTLHSRSQTPSSTSLSSFEDEIRNFDFLNKSWPFLDAIGDARFSHTALTTDDVDVGSWKSQAFPRERSQWQDLGELGDSSVISPKQTLTCAKPQTTTGSPVSFNSSGCSSDASTLYNSYGKHYNPSGSGHRAAQELQDYTRWINSTLNEDIVDVTKSLADGQTLISLVEVLLGITIRPAHEKPVLDVQRTENINMCLDVLQIHGVPVKDVDTEDIVKENTKSVLVLCQSLYKHFGLSPDSSKSPQGPYLTLPPRSVSPAVSPRTNRRSGWHPGSPLQPSPSKKSPVDVDDIALLQWVTDLTGQTLDGYESFQDGHVMCLLINQLTGGAVPDVVLEYGIPSEKICLALNFSKDELGVATNLNPEEILKPTDSTELSLFLKKLHEIFLKQKIQEKNVLKNETEGLMKQSNKMREIKTSGTGEFHANSDDAKRLSSSKMNKVKLQTDVTDGEDPTFSTRNTLFESSYLPIIQDSKEKDVGCVKNGVTALQSRKKSNKSYPKSRIPTTIDFSQDRNNKYLEEIKNEQVYRPCPSAFSSLYLKDENVEKIDNLESNSPANENTFLNGISRKSLFGDQENWKSSFKPLAPKSWVKEREKAKTKLDFLHQQLKLLKEEYFKYMGIDRKISEGHKVTVSDGEETDHLQGNGHGLYGKRPSTTGAVESFPSKKVNPTLAKPEHKRLNYSCNSLSVSLSSFNLGKDKGTTPPYRTWSKYVNTDGDRYCSKKTREIDIIDKLQRTDASHNQVGASPRDVRKVLQNKPKLTETSHRKDYPSPISPQGMKTKETSTENGSSDDGVSVSSTGSQDVKGRRFHGITALARLSSKRASATSDTVST